MQGLRQWRGDALAESVYIGRIKQKTCYEMKELFFTKQ